MSAFSRASSLSRSGSLSCLPLDTANPLVAKVARPPLRIAKQGFKALGRNSRRSQMFVRAQHSNQRPGLMAAVASVKDSCSKFLGRYDPIATGTGSLLVAGYCIICHGQSVGEALNVAAFATVVGMILQELLFHDDATNHQV